MLEKYNILKYIQQGGSISRSTFPNFESILLWIKQIIVYLQYI